MNLKVVELGENRLFFFVLNSDVLLVRSDHIVDHNPQAPMIGAPTKRFG